MLTLDSFKTASVCYYNTHDGHYYYAHPYQDQWDVIRSPSPRGRWNTSNMAIAQAKDLRVANLIAKTLSETVMKTA